MHDNYDPDVPINDYRAVVRSRYPFLGSLDSKYPIESRMRASLRSLADMKREAMVNKKRDVIGVEAVGDMGH